MKSVNDLINMLQPTRKMKEYKMYYWLFFMFENCFSINEKEIYCDYLSKLYNECVM